MFHLVVDKKRKKKKKIDSKSPKQSLPTFILRWHLPGRTQTTKAQKSFSMVNNVQAPKVVSSVEVKMLQRESKHSLILFFALFHLGGRKIFLSLLDLDQELVFVFMLAAKQKYLQQQLDRKIRSASCVREGTNAGIRLFVVILPLCSSALASHPVG